MTNTQNATTGLTMGETLDRLADLTGPDKARIEKDSAYGRATAEMLAEELRDWASLRNSVPDMGTSYLRDLGFGDPHHANIDKTGHHAQFWCYDSIDADNLSISAGWAAGEIRLAIANDRMIIAHETDRLPRFARREFCSTFAGFIQSFYFGSGVFPGQPPRAPRDRMSF